MINNILDLTSCYIVKCKNEVIKRRNIRDIWNQKINETYDDYINKKISRSEFIKKINKLNDDYYKSIENINLYNCEIDKCYKYTKKNLDYMAAKVNYSIKKNYTSNDYYEILKLKSKIK